MMTSTWRGQQLSRFMLGTVQFGMPYGVANRAGQPSDCDVLNIVSAAIDGGVNCFDTAATYGTSEEVLGRALQELGVTDKVTVVTKVRPLTPAELSDTKLAASAIEQSIENSRRRLRLDSLPVVLFHREMDAVHLPVLAELRAKGRLRHFGVSCDNRPGPAAEFLATGNVSALQIPGNVLDHRHQDSGIFRTAAARDVAVFARSVYIQGLLLLPEAEIPPALRDVIPVRRQLTALAAEAGMSLAELALRYMLSINEITCVLIGMETVKQVHDNLTMFQRGPLPSDLFAAVTAISPELPEIVTTPSLWPPKTSD
jgi:aryl-alcohol dehydrogenase-like predicted oxidoreductase